MDTTVYLNGIDMITEYSHEFHDLSKSYKSSVSELPNIQNVTKSLDGEIGINKYPLNADNDASISFYRIQPLHHYCNKVYEQVTCHSVECNSSDF